MYSFFIYLEEGCKINKIQKINPALQIEQIAIHHPLYRFSIPAFFSGKMGDSPPANSPTCLTDGVCVRVCACVSECVCEPHQSSCALLVSILAAVDLINTLTVGSRFSGTFWANANVCCFVLSFFSALFWVCLFVYSCCLLTWLPSLCHCTQLTLPITSAALTVAMAPLDSSAAAEGGKLGDCFE